MALSPFCNNIPGLTDRKLHRNVTQSHDAKARVPRQRSDKIKLNKYEITPHRTHSHICATQLLHRVETTTRVDLGFSGAGCQDQDDVVVGGGVKTQRTMDIQL